MEDKRSSFHYEILKDLENDSDNREKIFEIKKKIKSGEDLLEDSKKAAAIEKYMTAYKEVRKIWEQ